MEKKNTLLLTVIAVATLLVAVVGATFAYFGSFNTTVTDKAGVNVTTGAAKSSAFTTSAASLSLSVLGSEMLKSDQAGSVEVGSPKNQNATLNVSLTTTDATTTTKCDYDIYFEYDYEAAADKTGNAFYGAGQTPVTAGIGENKEFTYTLTPTSGIIVESTYEATTEKSFSVFSAAKSGSAVKVAHGSISSTGDNTANDSLTVNVKFYNIPTVNQSALADRTFAGKFFVSNESVKCGTTANS